VISHESENDREVFTTSGAYPWSFVTQIFHNGKPSHGGNRKTFEVTTSTYQFNQDEPIAPEFTLGFQWGSFYSIFNL
jgi:hypothetical protein